MADDTTPRIATLPLALVARETRGFSFQVWQPPLIGWASQDEIKRFGTIDQASALQNQYIGRHGGTIAIILDVPGWTNPFERMRRRG